MKIPATLVLLIQRPGLLIIWPGLGLEELEDLEADPVSCGQEGYFDLAEFTAIDLEDGVVGVLSVVHGHGGAVNAPEAEVFAVPGYDSVEVGDGYADVVEVCVLVEGLLGGVLDALFGVTMVVVGGLLGPC